MSSKSKNGVRIVSQHDGYQIVEMPIEMLTISDGINQRVALNLSVVGEYAEADREGAVFPPGVSFFDGKNDYFADGHHRKAARKINGHTTILVKRFPGSKRDAILYACKANLANGCRPSYKDRLKSLATLLDDKEWRNWSAGVISKHVGCAKGTVNAEKARRGLKTDEVSYTTRHGTTAVMRTRGISAANGFQRGLRNVFVYVRDELAKIQRRVKIPEVGDLLKRMNKEIAEAERKDFVNTNRKAT